MVKHKLTLITVLAASLLVALLAGCSHNSGAASPTAAPSAQPATASATKPAQSQNAAAPEKGYAQETPQQRMMDDR